MMVELDGELHDCHCPATGSIGNIVFHDIPCLVSRSNDPKEKHSSPLKPFHWIYHPLNRSHGLGLTKMRPIGISNISSQVVNLKI